MKGAVGNDRTSEDLKQGAVLWRQPRRYTTTQTKTCSGKSSVISAVQHPNTPCGREILTVAAELLSYPNSITHSRGRLMACLLLASSLSSRKLHIVRNKLELCLR